MADQTIKFAENSPEYIAYRLYEDIKLAEGRDGYAHGDNPVNREWILKTYYQCLMTVKLEGSVDIILSNYQPEVPAR